MHKEDSLHLIVIDDSSNDAEFVSNMLRNAGHAVRAFRVEDDEDLREAINNHPCDLILSKPTIPYFTVLDAISVLKRLEQNIPIILLFEGEPPAIAEEAMEAGTQDAIPMQESSRLMRAILRETRVMRERRAHRECRQRLQEVEGRVQALVESSRDAIAYIHDGMHIFANEPYLQLFGWAQFAEIEGLPVMDLVTTADQERFKEFFRQYSSGKATANAIDVRGSRCGGVDFDLTMEFSRASYEGEACTQVVIRDQASHKELEKKLDDLARLDLLTGLVNRSFFLEYLQRLFAKGERSGALLSVEPDRFKEIREEVGIAAADVVLADIAAVVKKSLEGEGNVVARFEDQTFVAVLLDQEAGAADAAANAVCEAVRQHACEVAGRTIAVSCSVGLALFDDSLRDALQVLSRADKARGTAKAAGGGRIHRYNPGAEEMAAHERLGLWTEQIKQALRENRFRLLYQPIVSVQGGGGENYQVLLRLLDDSGEEVSPGEFLAAAEQSGLMVAVDRWVLAHSAKLLSERLKQGKKSNLFVKISSGSLRDPKFLPWLRDLVKSRELEADMLTLEVSEAVALSNMKALKMTVEGLLQIHVRFALDHVGLSPDWSGLLRHCNAAFLKIDGETIRAIAQNKEDQRRLAELSAQAKEHGKFTIAQCVEDAGTMAALWNCGVDYIQGYFLQAPSATLDYDFSM